MQGKPAIDVLNQLKPDFCVLGNHEFDAGRASLEERMGESQFTWLGANVKARTLPLSLPLPAALALHSTLRVIVVG